jgi:hypothetical protein
VDDKITNMYGFADPCGITVDSPEVRKEGVEAMANRLMASMTTNYVSGKLILVPWLYG